ncbi:hypothetical protein KFZ70_13585 [Tamlana fucoidanivorans]|uniref:Uncharacterized protein n=1 Tax=Allotamlana fucoidanivorans TaxID=2583814 RepID=A0A5C4SR43_9FLAO|nr:hypothetical protein [Tamlana fucoidanivorans]TNJ46460.1 hypothetical protein FGF67_02205 [Tamlana fucoidanivorans]
MLKLKSISFTDGGRKVNYDYSVTDTIKKYFNAEHKFYIKYGEDVRNVPTSILVIPFLSNFLPISWFANFDIEVEEIDEGFNFAIKKVKDEFQKQFHDYSILGDLNYRKLISNKIEGKKTAMLFSGGVDAYATYIRTYDQIPDLVTILGADIDIDDKKQWGEFTNFIESEELLKNNKKVYIETNVRNFYTYQVELLLKDIGWWGKVQHGLSLIGSLAPISYLRSYSKIYIASSYTKAIDIAWGSTPQIDENITWSGIKVFHDGYELQRQDKVDLITKFSNETNNKFKLRVCYSELRTEFNCSCCEKCYRTILGIILNGKNPNEYGFNVDKGVYNEIFKVLKQYGSNIGMNYFWWELMEKSKVSQNMFVFENIEIENKQLERIRDGELQSMLEAKIKKTKNSKEKLKFILRNKYPWLIKLIKKIKV